MNTLKLIQKSKYDKIHKNKHKERSVTIDDNLIDLFPLLRYFQVHFQHIHENTHDLQGKLAQLKDYVAKVDEKLERLMALLIRLPEHAL
jgi:hypothetical protein